MLLNLNPGPFIFSHLAVKENEGELSGPKENRIPERECDTCRETENHLGLAEFGLHIPTELLQKLFTESLHYALPKKEFEQFVRRLAPDGAIQKRLLPGTIISKPNFRLLTKPRDFVWWWLIPFISERALNCIRERGVHVNAMPVTVRGRSRVVHKYFHLSPTIKNLADESWMQLEYAQCPACQEWWKKPGIRLPKIVLNDKAQIVKSRWPENEGVMYSPDIGGTYYSPEFVQACRDANLDGLGFTQVWWV